MMVVMVMVILCHIMVVMMMVILCHHAVMRSMMRPSSPVMRSDDKRDGPQPRYGHFFALAAIEDFNTERPAPCADLFSPIFSFHSSSRAAQTDLINRRHFFAVARHSSIPCAGHYSAMNHPPTATKGGAPVCFFHRQGGAYRRHYSGRLPICVCLSVCFCLPGYVCL